MVFNLPNWFALSLVAAFGFGITTVLWKIVMGKGLSPLLTTTYVFTFTGIMLWICVIFTQKFAFPTNSIILSLLLISSAIAVVANLASFTSLKLVSNPGYARAVVSISILIAAVISIFVFNLRLDTLAWIGMLFILIGLFLLSRVS